MVGTQSLGEGESAGDPSTPLGTVGVHPAV